MIDSPKILTRSNLKIQVDAWKAQGDKIVFTNGCFDVLHIGHVFYLGQAKKLGHRLVVGLNTDASVRQNKGESRPIVCEKERAFVVAALECVDAVVLFDEKTPISLIQAIQPAIHVKGGDYHKESLPEYPIVMSYGGDVQILPFYPGFSTSALIKKIEAL